MSKARWKVTSIPPASAIRRARALLVHPSVRGQQSRDDAVRTAFAGEADLLEHLAELFVRVEEIPAAGADHHAQPQVRDTPRQPDRRSGGSRAALVGRGAEFGARHSGPGCGPAGFGREGAEFGFDHLRSVLQARHRPGVAKIAIFARTAKEIGPVRKRNRPSCEGRASGCQRSSTVTDIGPCAPKTSACSMSAVFDGPDMKHP